MTRLYVYFPFVEFNAKDNGGINVADLCFGEVAGEDGLGVGSGINSDHRETP